LVSERSGAVINHEIRQLACVLTDDMTKCVSHTTCWPLDSDLVAGASASASASAATATATATATRAGRHTTLATTWRPVRLRTTATALAAAAKPLLLLRLAAHLAHLLLIPRLLRHATATPPICAESLLATAGTGSAGAARGAERARVVRALPRLTSSRKSVTTWLRPESSAVSSHRLLCVVHLLLLVRTWRRHPRRRRDRLLRPVACGVCALVR
jgi:hypothetical protein